MPLTYEDPYSRVQYAYHDPEPLSTQEDRTWFKCSYEVFHHRTNNGDPVARRNIWIKATGLKEAESLIVELVDSWKMKTGHEWDYKVRC
jgi:hypothetical protein